MIGANKPFVVATHFEGEDGSCTLVGCWGAPSAELAVAQAISSYYVESGSRYKIKGAAAMELAPENVRAILGLAKEAAGDQSTVVSLVKPLADPEAPTEKLPWGYVPPEPEPA